VKKRIAATLLLSALLLVACSNSAQPATAIPALSSTTVPAFTPTVSIDTVLPTGQTPDVAPEGQPVTEWDGIPIMPNALTGAGDAEGYVFTIRATAQQIREYYQTELVKRGWQPLPQGNGDSSTMLIFTNSASDTVSVSIIVKGEEALVILGK
jgi:hypothetical protein